MIKKVKAPVRIDFAGGTTDIKAFSDKYGGAVLNAAINKYITGKLYGDSKKVGLEYSGKIPTSSGLGTSGAMTLVWLSLISKNNLNKKTKKELAEQVYEISRARGLEKGDGKQDQYSSAFGGINLWEFGKRVRRKKVKISKKTIKNLEKKLIIVYTGEHYAGDSNKKIIKNLKKNSKYLKNIKEIAYKMKKSLEKGDLNKFSELLNQETENREKLARGVVDKKTKKIIKRGLKYADSAKILGAGSGGSVLFFGNKSKIRKLFKNTISFKFDFKGLRKI